MLRSRPGRLVYLSPVPLHSFAQRPHHFVRWFHDRFAAPVLWIDPGPSRLPRLSDWPRIFERHHTDLGPPWRTEPWIEQLAARVWPVEPWAWGRALNRQLWRPLLARVDAFVTPDTCLVMGKPCALALALGERHSRLPLVMDAMDAMPAFSEGASRRWMTQAEQALAQRADAILASSDALARHFASHGHKVQTVLNGLTPWSGEGAAPDHRPPGQPLVLGFVGSIDRWFDWPTVIGLARACPQLQVDLVGPVRLAPPEALPPNVRLHPAIAQHEVYGVMQRFDIGLIPFVHNDVTACVDPVKYYEYRAVGLPVLSSRFGQMAERTAADGVHFIEDMQPWRLPQLQALAASRLTPGQAHAFRQHNDWSSRFDALDLW